MWTAEITRAGDQCCHALLQAALCDQAGSTG